MKCCYSCFFFLRICTIANLIAERESTAEEDPLLTFWCSRYEPVKEGIKE